MRVAVTGFTGLIGSAVVERLAGTCTVCGIGRRASSEIVADFTMPESVATINLQGFDALIHCAGVVDEDFVETPEKAFRHAAQGTAALVDAASRYGVRRVALISSAHVYGPMAGHKNELSKIDPLSNYALAHFVAEQTFRRSVERFEAVATFRPCAVFGHLPDATNFRRWGLIPFGFPRECVKRGEIALRSSGEQRRNFVGSTDVANTIASWIYDPGQRGYECFNPVGSTNMSVWEFAGLCAERARVILGIDVKLSRNFEAADASIPFNYESLHTFCRGSTSLSAHVDATLLACGRI